MKIIEEIGEAAMLEQLAEECTELAKAALKMARIIRKENPTPVTEKDAIANIREEYTDVVQCAGELSLTVDEEQIGDCTYNVYLGNTTLNKLRCLPDKDVYKRVFTLIEA